MASLSREQIEAMLRIGETLEGQPFRTAPAGAFNEALRMALRYAWLTQTPCNSLHVTRDGDHACNYVTATEWIEEYCPEDFRDVDPAEVERMKATNTIWRVQIYPNTPVGFNAFHGATLDAAIDAALHGAADD